MKDKGKWNLPGKPVEGRLKKCCSVGEEGEGGEAGEEELVANCFIDSKFSIRKKINFT